MNMYGSPGATVPAGACDSSTTLETLPGVFHENFALERRIAPQKSTSASCGKWKKRFLGQCLVFVKAVVLLVGRAVHFRRYAPPYFLVANDELKLQGAKLSVAEGQPLYDEWGLPSIDHFEQTLTPAMMRDKEVLATRIAAEGGLKRLPGNNKLGVLFAVGLVSPGGRGTGLEDEGGSRTAIYVISAPAVPSETPVRGLVGITPGYTEPDLLMGIMKGYPPNQASSAVPEASTDLCTLGVILYELFPEGKSPYIRRERMPDVNQISNLSREQQICNLWPRISAPQPGAVQTFDKWRKIMFRLLDSVREQRINALAIVKESADLVIYPPLD
ncbi:uncharacterized protein LOC34623965 [Cyclospora cayetanensis]|uniref:Uncharacterized protein LOC34623965 n=1 Tax=Cyclospora cayetanensis TaxID=88456 RepID=A0A6P6S3F1_9EIME|nr:uncharacterized protein LOC34623965 [Cyclospora cayetanensis]